MKRLGEFRTHTRDWPNSHYVMLVDYKDGSLKELDIDMISETTVFLRVIENVKD